MTQDQAMTNPGPMGWGLPADTLSVKHAKEQKAYDAFASAAPRRYTRRDPKDVNQTILQKVKDLMAADGMDGGIDLTYVEHAVWGREFDWLAQIIGSCVASGGMRAWTVRELWEIFVLGDPESLFGTSLVDRRNLAHFAPYSYGCGRRRGGLRSGDGSFCSVHIEGLMKDGSLPCWAEGLDKMSDAFPEPQNASTYRKWGAPSGYPWLDQMKTTAKDYLLLESEKVDSAATSKMLIQEHMKPHMICSGWAFKPDMQHPSWKLADGTPVWIYTRNRADSWAHNMSIMSYVTAFGQDYVKVQNSWPRSAHKNGLWFIIRAQEFDTWLKDAESQSIGDIQLPPAMPLFW